MRGTLLKERPSAGVVNKPAGTSGKPKTPPRLQDLSEALQTRPPLFYCPLPVTPLVVVLFLRPVVGREHKKQPVLVWTAGLCSPAGSDSAVLQSHKADCPAPQSSFGLVSQPCLVAPTIDGASLEPHPLLPQRPPPLRRSLHKNGLHFL